MNASTRLPYPCRIWLVLVSCYLVGAIGVVAAEPNGQGTIEGVVTYRADPQRPWRYARYYIKQAKTGELAEAVVAIRGKGLSSAEPGAASTVVIDQKNFLFLPETVAIHRGDAVKFTNSDQTTHNVHVVSDLAHFNVNMPGGGSHTVTFDQAGGLAQPLMVGCVFHSAMRAWIFVFEHPFYQVTQTDGRFRLTGLPPGEYELEMAHPAGELRWRSGARRNLTRSRWRSSPGGSIHSTWALSRRESIRSFRERLTRTITCNRRRRMMRLRSRRRTGKHISSGGESLLSKRELPIPQPPRTENVKLGAVSDVNMVYWVIKPRRRLAGAFDRLPLS